MPSDVSQPHSFQGSLQVYGENVGFCELVEAPCRQGHGGAGVDCTMWVLGEGSTLSAGPRAFPRGYVVREEVGPVQQDGAELKRAGSECFCPWFPKGVLL